MAAGKRGAVNGSAADFERVQLLGVAIACLGLEQLLTTALTWAVEAAPRTIFYANAHCLNLAAEDAEYRGLLNRADLVYADGISLVWAAQWLGGCPSGRRLVKMTGADWLDRFAEGVSRQGLSLYLLGGRPGAAQQAGASLRSRWPELRIAGVCDGYFQEKSETQALAEIGAASPNFVLVGMGAPKQEQWIMRQRNAIAAPVCWGVGALLDYPAGLERRVPPAMNRLGLEWLWRLMQDPVGKWRRYLLGNPQFIMRVIRQRWGGRMD